MALSFRRGPRQESDECACLACHPEQMPAQAPETAEAVVNFLGAVMEACEARGWLLEDLEESR